MVRILSSFIASPKFKKGGGNSPGFVKNAKRRGKGGEDEREKGRGRERGLVRKDGDGRFS